MDFSDQPTQPKQIPWKLIAIIAGGVVLAAGIIGGVFFLIRQNAPQAAPVDSTTSVFGTPPSTEETTTVSTEAACDVSEDSEACLVLKTKERAITEKKSERCDVLTEEDKDDCFWSVARVTEDTLICEKMLNKDWSTACVNELHAFAAITASDAALCDKIADEQMKISCKSVIATATEQICVESDEDCLFVRVLTAANQAQDAEVCDVLDPKRSAECRVRVTVNDPDFDGIDSTQEIVLYGTDPRNPDTDGDGYSDGQEVNAGYDPLKK